MVIGVFLFSKEPLARFRRDIEVIDSEDDLLQGTLAFCSGFLLIRILYGILCNSINALSSSYFFINLGQSFAKYYLSVYFRAFHKGKIILLTFPHSPSSDLAEFDEVLATRWFGQMTVNEDHFTVELRFVLKIYVDK